MDIVKVKIVNFCYLIRMFKDKTYQSAINWYYGDMKNVDRIYKESGTIYNHFYKLSFKMSSIIDNLYLGNACDASYFYKLKNANIKAIVNVTKEIPNYFEEDFQYYNISLNDQNHENFTNEIFDKSCEFIDSFKGRNILIHCYMGSSRSATVMAAYLIKKYKLSLNEILELFKKKRTIVNINKQFMKNLQDYELYLNYK